MGNPKKLKSSIREALQDVVSTIKLAGGPLCIQPSRTESFREVFVSFNSAFSSSESTLSCTSCLSSLDDNEAEEEELSLNIALNSERFFFSPFISRSIISESSDQSEGSKSSSPMSEDSVPLTISSDDPYWDFRRSMEEMVAAYGLKDWTALQELFNCYLGLNERKNHRFIVLAFTDLVAELFSRSEAGSHSSPSLSKAHLYQCHAEL